MKTVVAVIRGEMYYPGSRAAEDAFDALCGAVDDAPAAAALDVRWIHPSITGDELHNTFSLFGPIKSVRLVPGDSYADPDVPTVTGGIAKGIEYNYANVTFLHDEHAAAAQAALDGLTVLRSKDLKVGLISKRKRGDEILEDEHEYEDDDKDAYLDENNDLSDEMDDSLY